MRFLMVAMFPAILLGQAGAVVEGIVVNSATRLGIPGVEVSLQRLKPSPAVPLTATTNETGAFRFEGVPDGEYWAGFGKPGFLPGGMGPGQPPLRVTAANGSVHLQWELAPFPKLRGRVVDGEGNPVAGATLQMVHLGGGGRPGTTSGKDGRFAFDQTIPGTFVVRAIPPPKLPGPKSAEGEPEVWAPTYYPGVTEQFRAEKIMLRTGTDMECEIKLIAVPVFHVRGVAVDEDGKPIAGAAVKLMSPDGLDARSHAAFEEPAAHATTADDGSFDMPAVRPGEWYLMGSAKRGAKTLAGVLPGTVAKGDWENVKLQLVVPFTVKGTVERDALGSNRHTWVGLIPAWQIRLMGIHDQSGAFEIDDIVPGKYQILLEEPLRGSYVDTVQFGGRDVLGQTVDVMDTALRLRVVYKTDGGRVQGSVEQCDRGTVVLMPKEPALQNSELMRWGRCDATGKFAIGNLRPGGYYAAAFRELDDFALYYGGVVDPALIARIIERSATVRVEAGQTVTVEVPMTEAVGR